jgi:alkylation response protein AidB-like acyl-CoA dehydrogenase
MNFAFSDDANRLRESIRSVLEQEWPAGRRGYRRPEIADDYGQNRRIRARLAQNGWFGFGVPTEYGGNGGTAEQRYVVAAEMAYFAVPYAKVALNMIVPMMLRYAEEDQKREYIPRVVRGEIEFSQAYTEPGAGSDLARLQMTARVDGDMYVLNGQKLYTSLFHRSEYCLVAVRTDPERPAREGISLIIVDTTTPGIDVKPLWAMGDLRTNVAFFDDIPVPRANLLGEENQGWRYLTDALGFERLTAFSINDIRAVYDDIVECVAEGPNAGDDWVQATLAQFAVEMRVLEALTRRAVWRLESGELSYEQFQVKVVASEFKQRLTQLSIALLGHGAQATDEDAPLEGALSRACEGALMHSFGGGANEIQRDMIATRALNLPRSAPRQQHDGRSVAQAERS